MPKIFLSWAEAPQKKKKEEEEEKTERMK